MTPSEIEDCFPQIAQVGYSITSPQTPRYNCIAWAAGDTRKWWWPDPSPFAYWPPNIPRENTLQRFIVMRVRPLDLSRLYWGYGDISASSFLRRHIGALRILSSFRV